MPIEVSIPQGFHEYDAEEMVVQRNRRIEELEAHIARELVAFRDLKSERDDFEERLGAAQTRINDLEARVKAVQDALKTGFMTCIVGGGERPRVQISFETAEAANALHRALLFPPLPAQSERPQFLATEDGEWNGPGGPY